jgi:hypothetical protein
VCTFAYFERRKKALHQLIWNGGNAYNEERKAPFNQTDVVA